jgi:ribosomal protein S4
MYFLSFPQIRSLFIISYNNLFTNSYKKKLLYVFLKKPSRHRYIWSANNPRLLKVKLSLNFKKLNFFFKKKRPVNKIIKIKRLTGLFKRRVNFRTTALKKRSFIFKLFADKFKDQFFKKGFKRFYKFRRRFKYRVYNINLHKHRKSIFFENRKIIKLFLKKKHIKRQNKLSSYLVSFLDKDSKSILNMFEYRLSIILVKSHFFNNLNDSEFFIKKGLIIVNNKVVFNPKHVVKLGDLTKINSKYFYYKFYKNSINNSIFMSKKLN